MADQKKTGLSFARQVLERLSKDMYQLLIWANNDEHNLGDIQHFAVDKKIEVDLALDVLNHLEEEIKITLCKDGTVLLSPVPKGIKITIWDERRELAKIN